MVTHINYLRMLRKEDSESEASLGYVHSKTLSQKTHRKGAGMQAQQVRTHGVEDRSELPFIFRQALDGSSPDACSKKKKQTKILSPQSFMPTPLFKTNSTNSSLAPNLK